MAAVVCAAMVFSSCGGSNSSTKSVSADGGPAPDHLDGDIKLTPLDANVHGSILLTDTPARVAYFNDGTTAGTSGAYTGNYTYTKHGPNLVEIRMDNVRFEPIETASDCHWTIIGHLTFVDDEKVVFTGTETLVGSEGDGHNDPMGFGSLDEDGTFGNSGKPNHFDGSGHDAGGTRNFSLNYTFTMGN